MSPTSAPLMRHGSGPAPTSDPRTFFNPLASNPVDSSSSVWAPPQEIVAGGSPTRLRGLTSSSQQPFVPHPPLRAATSIPDYGQFRGSTRPNPSGAYRPNRGGANWSHNDQFPPRHFRPEDARSSFRSGWTNASSSFVDTSGTERSSIATGRSSVVSDNRTSVYSRDHSGERSTDSILQTEPVDEEDDMRSAVDDVIDSYYGDEDEELADASYGDVSQRSPSPVPAARDVSVSPLSDEHMHLVDEATFSHQLADVSPLTEPEQRHSYNMVQNASQFSKNQPNSGDEYMPPLQLSPVKTPHSPVKSPLKDHINSPGVVDDQLHSPERERQNFQDIYNDLKVLPALPKNRSRMSRQDWADIEGYSMKTSRMNKNLHEDGEEASPKHAKKRPALAVHIPPVKPSVELPEVDEDEAYPRRASTSVFDRRSGLFDLSAIAASVKDPPATARAAGFGKISQPTGKRRSDQSIDNISPISPSYPPVHVLPSPISNTSSNPTERDRYGFKKATDKITVQQYNAWHSTYEPYVQRRTSKWVALMDRGGLPKTNPIKFPEPSDKVRRYARKGYPPEWRGAMWWFYSGGEKKLREMSGVFASLVARIEADELNKDDKEAIERDLDRTFPDNIHFRPDAAPGKTGEPQEESPIIKDLRKVLQCFALNNPGIGYCQSLNFIAGLLLLFMKQDVEKVFVLLTIITQTHLPGAHARNLANTEVNVLMMLIKDYLPKVWASINDTDIINSGPGSRAHPDSKFARQPTVALSCTSWFMSIFVGVVPIEVVLRIWDAFLYEGPRALYRYALAIFKLGEPEIRKFHPGDGELFMSVQNLPRMCLDPNILHDLAWVKKGFGSLSQTTIDQKRAFWSQQIARERSRKGGKAVAPQKHSLLTASTGAEQADEDKKKGGLRRKASRRFFKKDKAQ
jgi:hypothetical protein